VIKDASTRLREVEPLPNLSTRTLAAQSRASRLDAKRLDASEFDAKRLDAKRLDASEFDPEGLAHDARVATNHDSGSVDWTELTRR